MNLLAFSTSHKAGNGVSPCSLQAEKYHGSDKNETTGQAEMCRGLGIPEMDPCKKDACPSATEAECLDSVIFGYWLIGEHHHVWKKPLWERSL